MPGVQALSAGRTPAFTFDPADLVIDLPVDDPLHDPRVERIAVLKEDVLQLVINGAPPIEVRKRGDDNIPIDGKQRTKVTLVANALGAGIKYKGKVKSVKAAIEALSRDEELVEFIVKRLEWRFVCPSCGHIASIADWKAAGAPEGTIAFSCVGRYLGAGGDAFKRAGGPCNYAGGGLFKLNPVQVDHNGQVHAVFEFAINWPPLSTGTAAPTADTCEMLDVASNGEDTQEKPCTDVAVGTTEDKVSVCERHAEGMAAEGFEVVRDGR